MVLPLNAGEEIAVIVNKASTVSHLSKTQLRRMLLDERSSWPGWATLAVRIGPGGDRERTGVVPASLVNESLKVLKVDQVCLN